jgi:2,5-diketo-D-gluconate reductase A
VEQVSDIKSIPTTDLGADVAIPQLGFGVFQVPPEDTAETATLALEAGYRHIDTAAAYRNERGVGEALAASGLDRDDYFVTTKLWNNAQGYDSTLQAFDKSLGRLGLDFVDLYLIHWPAPANDRYVETWKAFQKLQEDGLIRAIGVSNFQPAHLQRLIAETGVSPAINQVELHPRLQQDALRAFHQEHAIVTEAWSPLAQGQLLQEPALAEIAGKHGKTPAQVVLRWHIELGNVVIPKSVTPSRIRENLELFDFQLDDDDLAAIRGLNRDERTGPDPDQFNG